MRRWLLGCLILLQSWGIMAQEQTYNDYGGRLLTFEESAAPFEVVSSSELGVCDQHYKHGNKSALWQWSKEGAQIAIRKEIGYLSKNPNPKETSVSTFVFWLYSPKPIEGSLRFEFLKDGKLCSWCDYQLGFDGWRGAWIAFDRDMEGTPDEGMNELRITVNGADSGELLFDHVILSSFQDIRHHTADFHAPYVNAATDNHWLVLLKSWNKQLDGYDPNYVPAYDAAYDANLITKRLKRLLLSEAKVRKIENLRSRFNHYNITTNPDGTVKGLPIWFIRYAETYINLGDKTQNKVMQSNNQTLRQYNDLMFDIAVAYNSTENRAQKEELGEMYITLIRHLLDQGFDAGSALGTLHHLGYSMRNFYTAPVLMSDLLKEVSLLERVQRAMEWFSGVGEVKHAPKVDGMDIDAFNTSMIGRLASILLIEQHHYKHCYLKAFARWVDNGFKITEGTSPCFKSDGTVFHHRHHYPAYALDGFRGGAVNIVWLLHDTQFDISDSSREVLRNALLQMRFYCNTRSFPLAMSGRHPDGKGAITPWLYARMAMLEKGNEQQELMLDREMAAAYMRMVSPKDKFYKLFSELGVKPEKSPEGNRIYGYNSSMSHRRGDWLLTVVGHSRYIWASEIYNNANHYGRYLAHGSVQLLKGSAFESGFRQEGWDWCHIPGTTALEIPMHELKANVLNVDTCSGYEEMLLSDEWFAGGVSHKMRNGAYSMKLHEHDKYNGSLRANKSVFAFDNRIICLGSDIENKMDGGLHTTLFQYHTPNTESAVVKVNGEAVTFPHNQTYDAPVTICDPAGNSYHVAEGRVHVRYDKQYSLHEENDSKTEGIFCTAWIEHQTIATDERYNYAIAVESSEKPQYRVLARNSDCHAVEDITSAERAAVMFNAGDCPKGFLSRNVSLPCLIMESADKESLTISVADPDLRLYAGESDEIFDDEGKRIERSVYSRTWLDNPSEQSTIEVKVKGKWYLKESDKAVAEYHKESKTTLVKFQCRESATTEVKLYKKL